VPHINCVSFFFTSIFFCRKPVNDNLEQVQSLKEEVWRMLIAPIDKLSRKLELIDEIECLGVSYNFESEIDKVLQQIYKHHHNGNGQKDDSLYTVALRF
jgi:(-)-germacrene D synthase